LPAPDLDREVDALAAKLCQWSPLAMVIQKDIIHKWMTTDLEAAIDFSINSVAINFASEDQKEGMTAFLEKRRPVFKGK
jgi:enoyl-CoA hydratase/carnithine racemase